MNPQQDSNNGEDSLFSGQGVLATCDKHGDYMARISPYSKEPIRICPKCRAERDAFELAQIAQKTQREYTARFDGSEIPEYFKRKTFNDYIPENFDATAIKAVMQEYARDFANNKRDNRNVVMFGTMGTGKTHLACATAMEVIKLGFSARYTKAITFLREVKSTWGKDATMSEKAMLATYENPDLLVIDELGMNFGSDAERVILFDLIDNRYGMMKPCILISNLSEVEFEDLIGAPLLNRMKDNEGIIFGLKWASKRG